MRSLKSTTTTTASTTSPVTVVETASAPAAASAMQRSPWHSPVPYLFGGLAAMLGLIAFALLILACSYWKQLNGEDLESGGDDDDDEKKKKGDGKGKGRVVYEEQFVVIMAGDHKPTCLAMPVCSRSAKLFSNESDAVSEDAKAADQSVKAEHLDLEEAADLKHQSDEEEYSNSNMSSEESHELHSNHQTSKLEPESSSSSS